MHLLRRMRNRQPDRTPEDSIVLRLLTFAAQTTAMLGLAYVTGLYWLWVIGTFFLALGHRFAYRTRYKPRKWMRWSAVIVLHLGVCGMLQALLLGLPYPQAMFAVLATALVSVEIFTRTNLYSSVGLGFIILYVAATLSRDSVFGVFLDVPDPEASGRFLTELFGYRSEGESEGRLRFRSPSGETADVVELRAAPSQSRLRMGRGSVHHVAFRATGEAEQLEWRERISSAGVPVTEVLDRQYFKSIYFREPGGVLYEIATDPPGFVKDEPVETLGRELKLPPWLEPRRADIEARLPDLVDPTVAS